MAFLRLQLVLAVVACCSYALAQGEWKDGRASFYGMDGWSIHKGSCGLGYQWPDVGTGWNAAAIADASPEFSGSCGRCYEVKCDPKYLHDGYGNPIDRRSGACKDPKWSVVVRTVDSCPCYYPENAYSNKRWCCGDNGYTHFDLSVWAFEKLADKKLGVIGLKYRTVPCSYKSSNPAPELAYPTPGEAPPPGAKHPDDYIYTRRTDWAGQQQGAVKAVTDASQTYGAPQVSYDSLFAGGGAFTINSQGTSNPFAASKILGSPFDTASAAASASASASSLSTAMASAFASSSASGSASASASASATGSGGEPLVMAFDGPSISDGGDSCSDQPAPGGFTCEQQKAWGACRADWMVKGGFCRQTCGGCESAAATPPQPAPQQQPAPAPSSPSSGSSAGVVYYKGFQSGWASWSFGASFANSYRAGVNGDQATCGAIYTYGGWQAGSSVAGAAAGKTALQFWTDAAPQALTVNLGSVSATCTAKVLKDVGASEQQGGYGKYYITLSSLGCPFGADQVTRVSLASAQQGTLNLCISDVRFL